MQCSMHFATNQTSIIIWVGLGVLFIWRQLAKVNGLQVRLHELGNVIPLLLQWYSLFILGCAAAIIWTLAEFLFKYIELDHEHVEANLIKVFNADCNEVLRSNMSSAAAKQYPDGEFTAETYFLQKLEVPEWLWICNVISMCLGFLVLVVVCLSVFKVIVVPSRDLALQHPAWRYIQWAPTKRQNWLLVIILMPLVFTIAVMRANCRIWGLLTGQLHHQYDRPYKLVESSMYAAYFMDLELAAICQFSAVWSFARITGAVLSDTDLLRQSRPSDADHWERGDTSPAASDVGHRSTGNWLGISCAGFLRGGAAKKAREGSGGISEDRLDLHTLAESYKTMILYAGFLGVWAYVVVGALRSLIDLVFCMFRSSERFSSVGDVLFTESYGTITTIFSVFTILCIINMFIICRSPIVRAKLGEANLKFLGTRVLLLVLDVQQKVLDAFVYGSMLFDKMDDIQGKLNISQTRFNIHSYRHSDELSKLKNLTLLNVWILAVAVLNLVMWHKLDLERSGFAKFKSVKGVDPNAPKPAEEMPAILSFCGAGQDYTSNKVAAQASNGGEQAKWLFSKEGEEEHDDDPWDF